MDVHVETKTKVNEQISSSKFDHNAEPEVLNDVTMYGGANDELLHHKIKFSYSKKGAKYTRPGEWQVMDVHGRRVRRQLLEVRGGREGRHVHPAGRGHRRCTAPHAPCASSTSC